MDTMTLAVGGVGDRAGLTVAGGVTSGGSGGHIGCMVWSRRGGEFCGRETLPIARPPLADASQTTEDWFPTTEKAERRRQRKAHHHLISPHAQECGHGAGAAAATDIAGSAPAAATAEGCRGGPSIGVGSAGASTVTTHADAVHTARHGHWCSLHADALGDRVPCPYEPRHHVQATRLESHLRVCQQKPGLQAGAMLPSHAATEDGVAAAALVAWPGGHAMRSPGWNLGIPPGPFADVDTDVATGNIGGGESPPSPPRPHVPLSDRGPATLDPTVSTVRPPVHCSEPRLVPGTIADDPAAVAAACHNLDTVLELTRRMARGLDAVPSLYCSSRQPLELPAGVRERVALRSEVARKHLIQHAAIAFELAAVSHGTLLLSGSTEGSDGSALPDDDGLAEMRRPVVICELCAGSGRLSKMIDELSAAPERNVALLVDRTRGRKNADGGLRARTSRITLDIADLRLCAAAGRVPTCDPGLVDAPSTEEQKGAAVLVTGKHNCGVATDFALRCAAGSDSPCRAVAIAVCCHHLADWDSLCGREVLEQCGIYRGEFSLLKKLATKYRVEVPAHATATNPKAELAAARGAAGRAAKRLINVARAEWLSARGWAVELVQYVPEEVTPENTLLRAWCRDTPRASPPLSVP
eukprot:m.109827 g.109827  ORF g.109827 m.109827 type:complete len:641 (+) comp21286_c0_seq1:87-2009(+)